MSTITREQLRERARQKVKSLEFSITQTAFADTRAELEEELELARIALASLEAEPVVEVCEGFTLRYIGHGPAPKSGVRIGERLYTAPPAPVSMPDENGLLPCPFCGSPAEHYPDGDMEGYSVMCGHKNGDCNSWIFGFATPEEAERSWNTRAAMLQGADGNSPAIPDGYCIMPLKLTADNGAKGALCGEFHVQYRIVCQSCVGEGCEDCNHTGGWNAEIPVSWDTIKRIHEAAVETCALPAAPQQEVKP